MYTKIKKIIAEIVFRIVGSGYFIVPARRTDGYTKLLILCYDLSSSQREFFPFKTNSPSHPAQWELSYYIAAAIKHNANVLVIHHSHNAVTGIKKFVAKFASMYSKVILIGQGPIFQSLIESEIRFSKKILLATESSPDILSKQESLAVATSISFDFELPIVRSKKSFITDRMIDHSDSILVIGSDYSSKGYSDKPFYIVSPTYSLLPFEYNDKGTSILWIGSSGLALKGFHIVARFAEMYPNLDFIAVGVNLDELKLLSKKLPSNLKVVEYIDMYGKYFEELLRNSKIAIFPYYCEGMSTAIMTMIGTGIPILASYQSGCSSLLPTNMLFDANNFDDMHKRFCEFALVKDVKMAVDPAIKCSRDFMTDLEFYIYDQFNS